MPFVLRRVPLVAAERSVAAGGVPITLRPLQPVAWARLVPWGVGEPAADGAFPAVIDTGNNGTVLIPESIFHAVTGLNPGALIGHHTTPVNGVPLRCYRFNLDLLRLRRGEPVDGTAARVQTDRGVGIIPTALESLFPRMPVIGVRCLAVNRLSFSLNGEKRTFSLWRPPAGGGALTPAPPASAPPAASPARLSPSASTRSPRGTGPATLGRGTRRPPSPPS